MIRARPAIAARYRVAGLSLIELMIALVLALIVAAGIITVFASTSSSNKAQVQMATLQEEGRFAIHNLSTDLSNANGSYCSNSGGNAEVSGSGLLLDGLRSPIVYTTTTLSLPDNTVPITAPTGQPYVLPSNVFMRGYECDTNGTTCQPADPHTGTTIPAMGTAVGDRVVGADVLTIRYLRPGSGWALVPSGTPGSTVTASGGGAGGGLTINLSPLAGEPPASEFQSGDQALIATCSQSGIYDMTAGGGQLVATSDNDTQPTDVATGRQAAPRVFDFTRDFQTVTYYLKVVCSNGNSAPGSACPAPYHTLGQLERRVNGKDQPLVLGAERLDFRYGVIDANGNTRYLTADKVDNQDHGAIACPPQMPPLGGVTPDPPNGCLWRAVQTIEVHILMDGQTPLYTLTPAELNYIYTGGTHGDITAPIAPTLYTIQPKAMQGFPEHMLRREFTTVVTLRNFNP